MNLSVGEINKIVKGKLFVDSSIKISSFSNIKDAKKGDVTFLSDMRYKKYLNSTKASLILVPQIPLDINNNLIQTHNPLEKFTEI